MGDVTFSRCTKGSLLKMKPIDVGGGGGGGGGDTVVKR
jgi:hypothetical protein